MCRLAKLIENAQDGNEDAMLELINNTFKPLINKYYKLLNYNEDAKSELILKLISVIKTEIHLDKMRRITDDVFVKYISTVIFRHYILLSKNRKNLSATEITFENDSVILDLSESNNSLSDENNDTALIDLLKSILTKKEFQCVYYHIFLGCSSEEMAKHLKMTKQACNQRKLAAFAKIERYYINNEWLP